MELTTKETSFSFTLPYTAPTVHENGQRKDGLLFDLNEVWDGLEKARDDLKQAAPNLRDYYMQREGAFEEATAHHMERMRMIDVLQADLKREMDCISEQGN